MKHANDITHSVLAQIQKRANTKGRKGPPACGNGFKTDSLPFARGHVIALELGGSDHKYNVVPQFEGWQGWKNGPWRQMEELLYKNHDGKVMLVELTYGRGGTAQDGTGAADVWAADRLMDWTDSRIPDGFTVKVWTDGLDPLTIDDDSEFDAEVLRLKSKVPAATIAPFVLGKAMPEPDRAYYINQAAIDEALETYDTAKPSLKREASFTTWLMTEGSMAQVRNRVGSVSGVKPTEALGVQATGVILGWQDTTQPKLKKRRIQREKEGHQMASETDLGLG